MHVAPDCPYCKKPSVFHQSSAVVYAGRDYGPVYACTPCQAWVGCHRGTTAPLGRLANKELRVWKQKAHAAFDPLWQEKMARGFKKKFARDLAYNWLAAEMGLKPADCHIGMFDVAQCQKVVEVCTPWLKRTAV